VYFTILAVEVPNFPRFLFYKSYFPIYAIIFLFIDMKVPKCFRNHMKYLFLTEPFFDSLSSYRFILS